MYYLLNVKTQKVLPEHKFSSYQLAIEFMSIRYKQGDKHFYLNCVPVKRCEKKMCNGQSMDWTLVGIIKK
jgi:hypothetical protein